MTNRYYIQTFGCQMNKHDSERIAGHLHECGFKPALGLEQADVILVNTCYVREKAMSKVFAYLGRLRLLKNTRPDLIIGVCGCGAQGEGKALMERMPWVDFISGPQEVLRIGELVSQVRSGSSHLAALSMPDLDFEKLPLVQPHRDDSLKAWVTIIEGCNNFCSYCVVPFVRGRERSRTARAILQECQELVGQGYKEVTLLGQNVNSYRGPGRQTYSFPELLDLLARESGLGRVRFVTSHPKDLEHSLIEVMARHASLCPFLHLPVQSGSDPVLAAMNRHYSIAHYRDLITAVRSMIPDIGLTTDIIVGFPGETEHDFQATRSLLEWVRYDSAYIFHYQVRSGTAAAQMVDSVPLEVKLARLAELVELQNTITLEKHRALLGKDLDILVEGPSKRGQGLFSGRSGSNVIVHFAGNTHDIGLFRTVRVQEVFAHSVKGTLRSSTG
ncbi:tRNA (N6-isopentenyl adenosine(37)-C2)-methylthiotransferase MiaB [bacterium]|nr:tRNA (N6-isopentenyl adenosine(37)-C2)-methylthiotransferase MiaB [bacterium]